MADPNFQYDPVNGWNDTTVFKDNPTDIEVRPMFQRLFAQAQTFINTTLIAWINTTFATLSALQGIVLGQIPDGTIIITKLETALQNLINGALPKNAGTIESYTEKASTNATATGTVTLDLSAQNVFELTLTGNTTIDLLNVPVSPKVCSITIIIHQDVTGRAVTFPASFSPLGGNIPDITAASKTHIIFASTVNGGTRWYYSAATNFTT